MLYICIPAFDEAPTVGVLCWRIRKVFENYPREYEVLVLDDGSTDATAETLKPYAEVMPLTVLRHDSRRGYGAAVETLVRAASARTRYPRRDALVLLQGDYTDQPEHIPELVKPFEGGADVVVAERPPVTPAVPVPVRRLRKLAPWVVRPLPKVDGVADLFGSFRLIRIAVIREMIKAAGDGPLIRGEGWAANVDLLTQAAAVARRIETVALEPRYDLRPRESRVRPVADAVALYRFGRARRGRPAPVKA